MQMKKPAWVSMPVLDVRSLTRKQLDALATAYDTLSNRSLDPLANLQSDPTRHAIDDGLADVLELPDLTHLRELLAREPGLNAREINARFKHSEMDLAKFENADQDDHLV